MDGTNLMSEDHSKALRFYLDKILKWNYRVTQFVSDLKHGIMTLTSIRKVVTDKKLNQIICAQLCLARCIECLLRVQSILYIYIYIYKLIRIQTNSR